jgi:hypothetical protein
MRARLVHASTCLLAFASVACSSDPRPSSNAQAGAPLQVATTTSPARRMASIAARQRAGGPAYAPRLEAQGVRLENPLHSLRARVDERAVAIEGAGWSLRLSARAFGRDGAMTRLPPVAPVLDGARIELSRAGGLTEWYLNGPLGLEQGFELAAAPGGSEAAVIELAIGGDLHTRIDDQGQRVALLDARGAQRASLGALLVVDADGRELPARFAAVDGGLQLRIDDAGARYPIHVDPILGTETRVISPTPSLYGMFGTAVGLRGDTMLVTEPHAVVSGKAQAGIAHVFVRGAAGWTLQQSLTNSDQAADDFLGQAGALGTDTAVVGASAKNSYQGQAYVFVRSAGVWTEQKILTSSDGAPNDAFGRAVGIDGDWVVIGAPMATVSGHANAGAAYVYSRTGTTWSASTKLQAPTPNDAAQYATSVAISGSTIAIGTYAEDGSAGTVHVYTRSGTTWTLQKSIKPSDTAPGMQFGFSVALDGDTLLAGAWMATVGANTEQGAAYVFQRTASAWAQQAKLVALDGVNSSSFGWSVALRGDTALVGGPNLGIGTAHPGAAYAFQRVGTAWSQKAKIAPAGQADHAQMGASVAVDGEDAVVAASTEDLPGKTGGGAVYVYHPLLARANGATCTIAGDCASGQCVDGVCCDTACTESCKACNLTGHVGSCSPVASGSPVGARTCTPSKFCAAGACSSACTAEADCVAGYYCDGTTCKKKGVGTCTLDKECTSGHCADGYCCDRACDGQCEACDVAGKEGTCAPVSGEPHGTKRAPCADGAGETCKAMTCDGATDPTKCTAFKNAGATCKAAACDGGSLVDTSKCDGAGSCVAPAPSSCGKYVCDATSTACKTSCTLPSDCATGFTCVAGVCAEGARCSDDRANSIAKNGDVLPCAPYYCGADGSCAGTCTSSTDCQGGFACNLSTTHCEPLATSNGTSDSGGCVSAPRGAGARSWSALVAAFAASVVAARRRRRA